VWSGGKGALYSGVSQSGLPTEVKKDRRSGLNGAFRLLVLTLMKPGSLCGSADLCTKSMKHQDSRPTFILY
jgi:hypothetical protein